MVLILRSNQRGYRDRGWLKSYHSFSFGDYYHPNFKGYKNLRVINEDYIAPKSGFPKHDHANMEIITYMLSGSLTHQDTLGHKEVIHGGYIQYMRAGSGVSHSELNEGSSEMAHLLQIWLLPAQQNLPPTYGKLNLKDIPLENTLRLICYGPMNSQDKSNNSAISINSDAKIYASILHPNHQLTYTPEPYRSIWIQVVTGKLVVNGNHLEQGDAIAIDTIDQISIQSILEAQFLLFDLGSNES